MTFTLNRVVLSCLAEIDLFAVLALADTSSTLCHFIHEQVLTTSLLRRFLQKHQYVLHHDAKYFRLLPRKHVVWLYRGFEKLRQRDAETAKRIDEDTFGLLYPLLGLIPFESFRNTAALPDGLSIPEHDWNGRPAKGNYTLEEAHLHCSIRLGTSWLHEPRRLLADGDTFGGFYDFHENYAQNYLREEFLLCKRYVDDFNTCYRLLRPEGRIQCRRNRPTMLAKVAKIREAFTTKNLSLLVQKLCIQAAVDYWYLSPNRFRNRTTSAADFKSLLGSRGWLEMWDESELGWWYSLGLWQYGPDCVESFIDQTFKGKSQGLLWLFLGAHRWFSPKAPRWEENEYRNLSSCCSGVDYDGCERDYLVKLVESLSRQDRIWTVRQIIRKAPDYGICRNLAANVFNYFILHDLKDADDMMCILLEEIVGSPLQYLFEYAISTAIAEHQNTEGVFPLVLDEARKFGPKLLRKDLDLYTSCHG